MTEAISTERQQELYDLAVRIGLAWRELRRSSGAQLRDWLYSAGDESIEQGQMDTLDLLAQRPAWRMSELADALRIDPSSATRSIQRLERLDLAARTQSADDGRVVEVHITPAGTEMHRALAAKRTELMTHILGAYRGRELPVLADLLERFVVAVDSFVEQHQPD
ncbi:MAG: hypothetical protein RLZ14_1273 [Actinomycetota bacterium]|jgi:DNA-binding MarR family transcriptional regulator